MPERPPPSHACSRWCPRSTRRTRSARHDPGAEGRPTRTWTSSWSTTAPATGPPRSPAACGALVCQLPYNLGVGGAMRAGYRYALRHDYDAAVQVDADGQHDPTYLKLLVDGLDAADIVVGARFAGEGELPRAGSAPVGDAAAGVHPDPAGPHAR